MRRLVPIALLLLFVVPLARGQERPPAEEVLKAVLELDEGQQGHMRELMTARQLVFSDASKRMTELQGAFAQAVNSPRPDPVAIGTIVISMRGIERELAKHQENFRSGFLEMLGEEQRQRVEVFKFVRVAMMGGDALERLGL